MITFETRNSGLLLYDVVSQSGLHSKAYLQAWNCIERWFTEKGWTPFDFQYRLWQYYLQGYSGLLNAPTGTGKTYALWAPALMKWIQDHPEDYAFRTNNGLQVLWVTPLRALANDTENALRSITAGLDIP